MWETHCQSYQLLRNLKRFLNVPSKCQDIIITRPLPKYPLHPSFKPNKNFLKFKIHHHHQCTTNPSFLLWRWRLFLLTGKKTPLLVHLWHHLRGKLSPPLHPLTNPFLVDFHIWCIHIPPFSHLKHLVNPSHSPPLYENPNPSLHFLISTPPDHCLTFHRSPSPSNNTYSNTPTKYSPLYPTTNRL